MDILIKQEPSPVEEVTQNSTDPSDQLSTIAAPSQIKQETLPYETCTNPLITTSHQISSSGSSNYYFPSGSKIVYSRVPCSQRGGEERYVKVNNETRTSVIKETVPNKLPIPRLEQHYKALPKTKHLRPVIIVGGKQLQGNVKMVSNTKEALPVFHKRNSRKQKPMGSATIFSNNQQRSLAPYSTAQPNANQQIPVGAATIFCTHQQQNTLPDNPFQQMSNQLLQIGSPLMSTNPSQQNFVPLGNSIKESTNQKVQLGSSVILSSCQQQNINLQNSASLNNNSNSQIETSPLRSCNNIFTARTGTALQQLVMPTVIQQPLSNISGFLIPPGTTFVPSSALVTCPSNSQMIQPMDLMASLPVGNVMPLFHNMPTGMQNAVLIGNQNNFTDFPSSQQQLTFGIPIIAGNVSTGEESKRNNTNLSVSNEPEKSAWNQSPAIRCILENTVVSSANKTASPIKSSQEITCNQVDNKAVSNTADHFVKCSQASDTSKTNASNCHQRVVFLRKPKQRSPQTSQSNGDKVLNIDSTVPYIETLPSGQQIIRNLNPVDMKCISGFSVPLLPLSGQNTTVSSTSSKQNNSGFSVSLLPSGGQNTTVISTSSKQNDLFTCTSTSPMESSGIKTKVEKRYDSPGSMYEQNVSGQGNGDTCEYSVLSSNQMESRPNILCKNHMKPTVCFNQTSSSEVGEHSFPNHEGNGLAPLTSGKPVSNPAEQDRYRNDINKDSNVKLNAIGAACDLHVPQSESMMTTPKDGVITFQYSKSQAYPNVIIKIEQQDGTSVSVKNTPIINVTNNYSSSLVDSFHGQKRDYQMESLSAQEKQYKLARSSISAWERLSRSHSMQQVTKTPSVGGAVQASQKQKRDSVVKRRVRQPYHVIKKIKMRTRLQGQLDRYLEGKVDNCPLFKRRILPKCIASGTQTDMAVCDGNSKPVDDGSSKLVDDGSSKLVDDGSSTPMEDGYSKPKEVAAKTIISSSELFVSDNKYVHHGVSPDGSDSNHQCQNPKQPMELSTESFASQEEASESGDSIQIKIDTVFSLNEESGACFLASKSPYHHPHSFALPSAHRLDSCFVVLEKETHSRFLALQMKVSRLRPKRACSKQCRAQALHTMCQKCYFSPVLVEKCSQHSQEVRSWYGT